MLADLRHAAAAVALCCQAPAIALAQGEQPAEIIAAHVRTQGYECREPRSARHEAQLSRPNAQVWLLECANATYRITLVPDLQAKVERLE